MDVEFSRIQLVIFDVDGTLRRCTVEGQPCPNQRGEQEVYPGVRSRIYLLEQGGVPYRYATNQGGIALGYTTLDQQREIFAELGELLATPTEREPGITSSEIIGLLCPDAPGQPSDHRKPAPGMLLELMERVGAEPSRTLMIGDRDSDREAARAAGCGFAWAWHWNPQMLDKGDAWWVCTGEQPHAARFCVTGILLPEYAGLCAICGARTLITPNDRVGDGPQRIPDDEALARAQHVSRAGRPPVVPQG